MHSFSIVFFRIAIYCVRTIVVYYILYQCSRLPSRNPLSRIGHKQDTHQSINSPYMRKAPTIHTSNAVVGAPIYPLISMIHQAPLIFYPFPIPKASLYHYPGSLSLSRKIVIRTLFLRSVAGRSSFLQQPANPHSDNNPYPITDNIINISPTEISHIL